MRKGLFKWFDWHWSPEDTKIRSVVEILTFVVIVGICGFLYVRWNTIPIREIEMTVEDLSNGRFLLGGGGYYEPTRHVARCNVTCCIPMTTHEEFVKDTAQLNAEYNTLWSTNYSSDSAKIVTGNGRIIKTHRLTPLQSDYSDFIRLSFLKDSIRNTDAPYDSLHEKIHNILMTYDLLKIDDEYRSEIRVKKLKQRLDSLRKSVIDIFHIPVEKYSAYYFQTSTTMPFFSSGGKNFSDTIPLEQDCHALTKSFSDKEKQVNENYVLIPYETPARLSNFSNSGGGNFLGNFYYFFRGGTATETPRLLRLEDISQAYVKLKLNSSTIDSIVLNIDFVGVTEFSAMSPVADEIGMSNIVFRDPVKIYKIRHNGLLFHAKFRELENIQQIRTFTVTAIGSAFVFALVVFAIFAYYRIREKIKNRKKKYSFIINCLLGYLLCSFIYWTTYYFIVDDPNYITYLLTILILLSIIILTDRVFRNYLLNLLHKVNNIRKKKETK